MSRFFLSYPGALRREFGSGFVFEQNRLSLAALAAAITREASRQTFYTIRCLVDRPLIASAYRA
jgi:hypothetical protein